jgi:hypothetical protein
MTSMMQTKKGFLVNMENYNFLVDSIFLAEDIMDDYRFEELEISEIIEKYNLAKKSL